MTKIIALILLVTPVFAGAQPEPENKTDIYKTITGELLKDCTGVDKKIAVAGFSYSDGRDSRDGGVVAERITTELVKAKKFKVIERKEIEKVFEELKLQRSGAINPDSAKEIGKMLGADWMVVGTLTELPDMQLELSARIVGVESGEILSAASGQAKKDWLDQYRKLLIEESKAIEKNSRDAIAFYERGVTNIDLAEYDSAIADFSIAITINPTRSEAYLRRGYAYARSKKNNKALADFNVVISTDPTNWKAYACRGTLYAVSREYSKALEDFNKVIEIVPMNGAVYAIRGYLYYVNGEYNKAIEDYSKAIALEPKNTEAYIGRGDSYRKKGETDKAIKDDSKAIEINPKNAETYKSQNYPMQHEGENIPVSNAR